MRIAISPDENPGDSGSVAADGTTERSVNLGVATALQAALARCGQDVWFDPTITYVDRTAKANSDGTQLLVACAHNESTAGLSGTQFVFCTGGEGFGRQAAAADAVYAELAKLPNWPARRSNVDEAIYECCQFGGDTVYIEYLYMSPEDETIWSQPTYPQDAAEATARGLAATYGFTYVEPTGGDDIFMAGPLSDPAQQQNVIDAVDHIYNFLFYEDDGKVGKPAIATTLADLKTAVANLKQPAVDATAIAAALAANTTFLNAVAAATVKLMGQKESA
jgi:N-acetylmuramoyl-L-alanine amidase